jgi:hypothetical protein
VAQVVVAPATAMVELAKPLRPDHVDRLPLELVRLRLDKIKVIFTKTVVVAVQVAQVAQQALD